MKKNILFRIGTLQSGGAERMLVDILNNLDTNIYEITLLLNVKSGVFINELNKEINVKYLYKELEWSFVSKYFPMVSKIIRTIKHKFYFSFPYFIQKFILEDIFFNTSVCFLQDLADSTYKIKSKNKILWVHSLLSKRIREDSSLKNHLSCFLNYDTIITISDEVKLDLLSNFNVLENKIKTLHNPIDKNKIINQANIFYPKEFKNLKTKLKIVSVGRIIPSKGFHRFIELKQKLINEKIDAEIFIIGQIENKDFYNDLKKKINNSGVSIYFLGIKENPYPYIKNADIIIQPSVHEGYGLVVAESLVLNTPIIASNLNAYKEFAKEEIFYALNTDKDFPIDAFEFIKKIQLGQKKGNINSTNILDIKEYINKLNTIF